MVKKKSSITESVSVLDESDYLAVKNSKKREGLLHIQEIMEFHDANKVKEVNLRVNGSYRVPSSFGGVTFSINENGSFIDFNLSIPKYLYGHSLAEFVPQARSSRYMNNPLLIDWNEQRKIIYKRLMSFIDYFCNDLCQMFQLDTMPNKDYIEVRRIDLCYNQYFDSKKDALSYLDHQKKLIKIKQTKGTNLQNTEYQTSLTYLSQSGAYFKIYHKGTEYSESKNGDLKKHLEINKAIAKNYLSSSEVFNEHIENSKKDFSYLYKLFEDKVKDEPINLDEKVKARLNKSAKVLKRLEKFKVDFLKQQMDKILRYEVSLRGDFLTARYKRKIFRKEDFEFKQLKENYDLVHHMLYTKTDKKPNSIQLSQYKLLNDYYNRSISLVLSNNPFLRKHEVETTNSLRFHYEHTILSGKDVGRFSNYVLDECVKHFRALIGQFKIEKLSPYDEIDKRIDDFNLAAKQNLKNYNEVNEAKCFHLGKRRIKGNALVMNASQLLTQSQKVKLGLKTINKMKILQIVRLLESGYSLQQIRQDYIKSRSTFSRLKKDLEMLEIHETTLDYEIPVCKEINFAEYYHQTKSIDVQQNMFVNENHLRYG